MIACPSCQRPVRRARDAEEARRRCRRCRTRAFRPRRPLEPADAAASETPDLRTAAAGAPVPPPTAPASLEDPPPIADGDPASVPEEAPGDVDTKPFPSLIRRCRTCDTPLETGVRICPSCDERYRISTREDPHTPRGTRKAQFALAANAGILGGAVMLAICIGSWLYLDSQGLRPGKAIILLGIFGLFALVVGIVDAGTPTPRRRRPGRGARRGRTSRSRRGAGSTRGPGDAPRRSSRSRDR